MAPEHQTRVPCHNVDIGDAGHVIAAKLRELAEEFRAVVAGRGSLFDSLVPPLAFAVLNGLLGFDYALWGSLALAILITAMRLARHQRPSYALGGLGAVIVAILLARLLGRAEGYFLPGIATGVLTMALCGVSVIAGRPLVAWSSHLARRWPLDWYWHPRVRPAYSEVTLAWTLFLALRVWGQVGLLRTEQQLALAVASVVLGWPATVVLLAASYLYGTWRLQRLNGPSVDEFRTGADPPWAGQRRGF